MAPHIHIHGTLALTLDCIAMGGQNKAVEWGKGYGQGVGGLTGSAFLCVPWLADDQVACGI